MALLDPRKQWNPHRVLGLDPLANNFTCVGRAVTKQNSRCRWMIDGTICVVADDLLNEMAATYMIGNDGINQLHRLAKLLLCEYHQYQAKDTVKEWAVKIQELERERNDLRARDLMLHEEKGNREDLQNLIQEDMTQMRKAIQAMEEMKRKETQSASSVTHLSELQARYAALENTFENLRKNQTEYEDMHRKWSQTLFQTKQNLAIIFRDQGRYTEAEQLYERALAGHEQPGPQQALEVRKSVLGNEHTGTLELENSDDEMLASLYYSSSNFSEASVLSSLSRYCTEELLIVKYWLISILANDEKLQPFYSLALKNPIIGAIRFENKFRRLLKQYAKELSDEAQGALQKNAALVVRVHANDIAIAIRKRFDSENIENSKRIGSTKMYSSERANVVILDRYLSGFAARSKGKGEMKFSFVPKDSPDALYLLKDTASDTDVISDQRSDNCNSADDFPNSLPSLTEVKQFMVQGNAFNSLRQQLDRFVHPEHDIPHVTPTSAVIHAIDNNRVVKFTPWTMTTHPGFIDRIKEILEKWIRNPIIWWPLQPRIARCPTGYTRISWSCACGAELSVDIPDKVAKEYLKRCSPAASTSTNQPVLPLHNTALFASSSGASTQTQTAAPSSSRTFQRSPQQPVLNAGANSAATRNSLNPNQYIHWCVDASRYETKLNHIPILALDDANFVSKLKSAYNTTRGFRRWISLTACYGVRFVVFERINRSRDLVACGKEDLPCSITNREYAYSYKDPREQFIKTLEKSLMHSFHNPGSCGAQDIEDIIKRIPKKINGRLEKEYGVLGYGMHALPGWAVWKLMVALFLSQIGPSVFLIRWLYGHPGDLQNAFSLSMYLIALLNLMVVIPDVWSLQK